MLKKEAIKKHRAMWKWIAEQIVTNERTMDIAILKRIYVDMQGDDAQEMHKYNNCYLCYYAKSGSRPGCRNCPLLWPSEANSLKCELGYKSTNGYSKGLYNKCFNLYDENDWQLQAKLCREIANLPERKMSNEKH